MGLADIKLVVLNFNLQMKDKVGNESEIPLFRKQGSLFLHGATGAGKTTMLEKTMGKSPEELKEVTHTIGGEVHLVSEGKESPIMVTDVGGDMIFEDERLRTLNEIRPLAILLLLDHAPRKPKTFAGTDIEFGELYKCPPKGLLPEDETHPVRVRYEQHIRAIQELKRIFFVSPAVADQCRLVLPIVNKRDSWEALGYSLHIFTDWYFEALQELNTVLSNNHIKWHRPIGISGKYEGFGKAMDIVGQYGGQEMLIYVSSFLNLTLRVPTSQKPK